MHLSLLRVQCQTWFSSVQLNCSVMSDSLWPRELQHARPPCPSPTPRVHSNSCPSSQWCHLAISSSVVPFSSCPQSLPAPGSFPMSQLFTWGGQSIGVSASASFLPMNTQDWSPLGWTGWIPLQSKGLSRVFSNTTVQKHQFFSVHLSSQPNSHINTWPLESHWNNGCSLTPHAASHICVHCILLLGLLFSDIQLSKSCLVRITSEFYPGTLVSVDTLLSLLSQCLYTFSSSMYQASLQWRVSTPLPLSRLWAPAGRASLSVIVSGRYNYPVRGSELNCWVQSLVSSQ